MSIVDIPDIPPVEFIDADSQIILCSGIPWDDKYRNVRLFNSKNELHNFINSKQVYTFNKALPIRDNVVKIPINQAIVLSSLNYIAINNPQFNNKWIYGFITSSKYVSANVCEITFSIDIFQTFFYDCEFKECIVEREMINRNDDLIGENRINENILECSYIINKKEDFTEMTSQYFGMLASTGPDGSKSTPRLVNGIYNVLDVIGGIPTTDTSSVLAIINQYIDGGRESGIINAFQYPSFMGDASTTTLQSFIKTCEINLTNIDGYIPKNKKCFNYPYNFIQISNNQGNLTTFKLEDFNTANINQSFKVYGGFVPQPSCLLVPTNYKGQNEDFESAIPLSSFPTCSIVGDVFKEYINQNRNSIDMANLSNVVGLLSNPTPEGVISESINYSDRMAKMADLKNRPPQTHGKLASDNILSGTNKLTFTFYQVQCRQDLIERVDKFFSYYGYATSKFKIPILKNRNLWNYVKTQNCYLKGSIGYQFKNELEKIFDNGVFIWHTNDIGNFDVNNNG